MASLYAIISIAGWAFFAGLLVYLVTRGRRTDAPANEGRLKDE